MRAMTFLGDSAPKDIHIEVEFARRWPGTVSGYVEFVERFLGGKHVANVPVRLKALIAASAEWTDRPLLVGRSSGALIAAGLAAAHPERVLGVVALGYPLRNPNRGDEPHRYELLAGMTVPLLILQGARETYGTKADIEAVRLSPAVTIVEIDTNHQLHGGPALWDTVAAHSIAFARRLGATGPEWRSPEPA